MIELTPVKSSHVRAAGYDDLNRIMYISFYNVQYPKTGVIYQYPGTDREFYDQLMAAESKGQFVDKFIVKKRLVCRKLSIAEHSCFTIAKVEKEEKKEEDA